MRALPRLSRPSLALVTLLACTLGCPGDTAPPEAGAPAASVNAPAPAPGIDPAEAERLRALGYGDVAENTAGDDFDGVRWHDRERTQPGLNYFTNVHDCSSQLVTLEGKVLRSWAAPGESCGMWGNSVLLANGDVLTVMRNPRRGKQRSSGLRELLRLDRDGNLLLRARRPVHHDVELTPRGEIATLEYDHRLVPEIDPQVPVRDHQIVLLGPDGAPRARASLLDLLRTAPPPFRLRPVEPHFSTPDQQHEIDLIHSNSIEWIRRAELAERDPIYAETNLLLSLRHQDAVVIVDWSQQRVVWTWGQGELSGPHDATLLANGHVLVFDNGLGRDWSRVVEVDPLSREIVWEYRAPEGFFTRTRGAAQRLDNGNTLITDSEAGRVFEVTPDGEVVWEFFNPNRNDEGERSIVVRMRRLPVPVRTDGPFAWSD